MNSKKCSLFEWPTRSSRFRWVIFTRYGKSPQKKKEIAYELLLFQVVLNVLVKESCKFIGSSSVETKRRYVIRWLNQSSAGLTSTSKKHKTKNPGKTLNFHNRLSTILVPFDAY